MLFRFDAFKQKDLDGCLSYSYIGGFVSTSHQTLREDHFRQALRLPQSQPIAFPNTVACTLIDLAG